MAFESEVLDYSEFADISEDNIDISEKPPLDISNLVNIKIPPLGLEINNQLVPSDKDSLENAVTTEAVKVSTKLTDEEEGSGLASDYAETADNIDTSEKPPLDISNLVNIKIPTLSLEISNQLVPSDKDSLENAVNTEAVEVSTKLTDVDDFLDISNLVNIKIPTLSLAISNQLVPSGKESLEDTLTTKDGEVPAKSADAKDFLDISNLVDIKVPTFTIPTEETSDDYYKDLINSVNVKLPDEILSLTTPMTTTTTTTSTTTTS